MKWREMIYTSNMLEMVGRNVLGSTPWMDIAKSTTLRTSFRDVFGTVSGVTLLLFLLNFEKILILFFSLHRLPEMLYQRNSKLREW